MLQLISSGPVFCAEPEPSRFAVKMIWNSIQWEGNANAEIISPFSAGKPELSKVLFFSKARSKSEYSFACFAKCQELRVFNFVLPVHSAFDTLFICWTEWRANCWISPGFLRVTIFQSTEQPFTLITSHVLCFLLSCMPLVEVMGKCLKIAWFIQSVLCQCPYYLLNFRTPVCVVNYTPLSIAGATLMQTCVSFRSHWLILLTFIRCGIDQKNSVGFRFVRCRRALKTKKN